MSEQQRRHTTDNNVPPPPSQTPLEELLTLNPTTYRRSGTTTTDSVECVRLEWMRLVDEQDEKCRLPACFIDITGTKASVTVFRASRTVFVPIPPCGKVPMLTRSREKQYTDSMSTDIITRYMSIECVAVYLRENFIEDYEAPM